MYQFIVDVLQDFGLGEFSRVIAYGVMLILGIVVSLILRAIIRGIADSILKRTNAHVESPIFQALIDSKLVKRTSNLVIPLMLVWLVEELTEGYVLLARIAEVSFVVIAILIIFSCIKSIDILYSSYESSRNFPIHGILQVATVASSVIGGGIIISLLMGVNPTVLLGSVGAMTAVTTLVFKDAILGFIAGIQLTTNNMIRIGDWIEVPRHSANGFVIDITMTTVKVENFDKTITSIPAYTLVSESFINWRGVLDTGGRRIKRPINIDATMVRICSDEMIEKYKSIALIKDYIECKQSDIRNFNNEQTCDTTQKANCRSLTNIGTFRAYITAYLRQHPQIRQDLTIIVRQLDPSEKGIALEIIAFANATSAVDYEAIQADIFDHLYAVITEFDLRLFQNPSSNDVRQIVKIKESQTGFPQRLS